MSIKSIIAIILAMCGSFTTILAVVGYVAQPEPTPRRPATRAQTTARPTPQLRAPRADEILDVEARGRETRAEREIPDVPTQGDPIPLPDQVSPDLITHVEPSLTPQQIQAMAREATRRLDGVGSSLSQQVVALKKSRDAMLDQLAEELRGQAPSAASTLLMSLDNELAVLTLKRLTRAERQAILDQIPGKRRSQLQRKLR